MTTKQSSVKDAKARGTPTKPSKLATCIPQPSVSELAEILTLLTEDCEIIECRRCDGTGKRLAHPDEACHQCAGAGEIVPQCYWPQHVRTARTLLATTVKP